ncbi:MAG: hypothetical protein OSA81_07335 [Longimicrobiales bacterium]|nr:hypothetical protein [Longimicrobiales bacterium]
MSHVDKGALHAYLDGALEEYPQAEAERIREHIAGCVECAEMLEIERAVRSDAEAMLGLALPAVDLPSLEELRAYVKRTRPVGQTVSVRMYRMGWAASIALALGTGWVLRGGQLIEAPLIDRGDFEASALEEAISNRAPAALREPSLADRDSTASRLSGSASVEGSVAAPERAVAGGGAKALGARGDLPADQVTKARSVMPDASVRSEAAQAESPSRGQGAAGAGTQVAAAGAVLELASEVALDAGGVTEMEPDTDIARHGTAEALANEAPTSAVEEAPAALSSTHFDDMIAAVGTTAAPPPAAIAELNEVQAAADSEQEAERRRSESRMAVTSALDQSGLASRPVMDDDADRQNDEPNLVVLGYEVLSVTNMGGGTMSKGVHVVQRLEGAVVFEIYHLELDVEPTILPAATGGLNEVSVLAESGWIVLRGPRAEEELQGLLDSLFPEG